MLKFPRPLHFVLKIANRAKTMDFYSRILGMKVLRHEEFTEGCNAACNGPYDGKWSKTMIGYGEEDNHFVLELTYNYGIRNYELGNDFNYIEIMFEKSKFNSIRANYQPDNEASQFEIHDPNGYKILIKESNSQSPNNLGEIRSVSLFSSNLERSMKFWQEIIKAKPVQTIANKSVNFGFDAEKPEFNLNLVQTDSPINHATSYGRIAFSCPTSELEKTQNRIEQINSSAGIDEKYKILTPLITLDTPGKASVSVVIMADPDGHEICFVGDEGFRELSKFDPDAEQLLNDAMSNDKSDEWHEKRTKKQ